MRLPSLAAAAAAAFAAAVIACSAEEAPECRAASDCPSGSCVGGRCAAPPPDAGTDAGAPPIDAGEEDAGVDAGEEDAGADAGEEDAGVDGGEEDAGFDAGCWGDPGDPPNRAPNPGFECGDPPEEWVPGPGTDLSTETASPHSGAQAARLVSIDGGAAASLFPLSDPVQAPGSAWWCASAYVRGEADGGTIRIGLRAHTGSPFVETSFSEFLHTGWQRIEVGTRTQATHTSLDMRVWLNQPSRGDAFFVDDVQLWSSADGGCSER